MYVLTSCTYFDVCRDFMLEFLNFVVGVNSINLETAISENIEDLFHTIYDV